MANREEQLKQITEQLEQGVAEIFTSEKYTEYLNTMAKFHNYSFNNTLLIAIQLNDNDSIELIKRYLKEINIEVPYYKFGLKELELELEKKSGKIMRLLNKLSPLKKYLILQPQLNGVGINVEKILEDLKK